MEDCDIGMWHEYESRYLVTYEELKKEVEEYNNIQESLRAISNNNNIYKNVSLLDLLDRRKATCLTHFNNCPWCGKKIDWKELRNKARK